MKSSADTANQLVEVLDGSYSFLIETGEHMHGVTMARRRWKIIDFMPLTEPRPLFPDSPQTNDCIIESVDVARQKVSIQSRFLRPLEKHCSTCQCNDFVPRGDWGL